jgi:hypothetical protein
MTRMIFLRNFPITDHDYILIRINNSLPSYGEIENVNLKNDR